MYKTGLLQSVFGGFSSAEKIALALAVAIFILAGVANATVTVNVSGTNVNGGTIVSVDPGSSIIATVSVTGTGGNPANRWRATQWRVGSGAFACVDHANHANNAVNSETFLITAPGSAAGIYDVEFIAWGDDSCTTGSSATMTMSGAVTVQSLVVVPLSDTFGTSDSAVVSGWTEGGPASEKQEDTFIAGTSDLGDDQTRDASESNKFAKIGNEDNNGNNNEYICRTISTVGYHDIQLSYYWKKDSNAESGDKGVVEYKMSGGCSGDSGWTEINSHVLNGSGWSSQIVFSSFDSSVEDGSFLLRFRNFSNKNNEYFRVDDVVVSGDVIPTASIIIVKNTIPNDGQDFDFLVSGTGLSSFTLDDDDDFTLSNTQTFTGLGAGSYTVTESAVAGFDLTDIVCDDPTANSIGDTGSREASIELVDGETVTCAFTNMKYGTITVRKTLIPDDAEGEFEFSGTLESTLAENGDAASADVLPGEYAVSEAPQDGWDLTAISCDDENSSGSVETRTASFIVEAGETVVCDFTNTKRASFSLEKFSDPEEGEFQFDLTGPAQDGILASHTFTPSGTWNLDNLLSGIYSLSEIILAPLDPLWTGSQAIACDGNGDNDPSGSVASPFEFTLNPGEAMSCSVNNTQDALITGKKFEDMDADGIAGDDSGIAGWTITATQQDNPETEELESGSYEATTDDDGDYTLRVQPGIYYICETGQDGWTQSYPVLETVGAISCDGGYGYGLTVSAGGNTSGNDFGNYQNGSISGYKLEDADADGDLDEDETALDEWIIFLDTDDDGNLDEGESYQETGDEEEGYYYFGNLIPGTYIVREVLQSGWMQTYPGVDNGSKHTVTVTSGEDEENLNFGNFQLATISGFKWDDTNGDGVWQKSCDGEGCVAESGKQDIIVGLGRQNGDPIQKDGHETIPIEIIAMTLTGNDGGFAIHDVAPGHYKLFEETKSGWSATNPAVRADSFFDISYDLKAIAIGDPDFDLLRIGDPDFDLLRDSFFDIFVELSGQALNQSEATQGLLTTIPSVPLEFGNHKLLVLSQEAAIETKETSTVIAWTTDFPGTSRVVYDTVSHPVLGSAPNYGYANSTVVFDESPKVTNHSVSISSLDSGITYYYRTISAASPESVSSESSFSTPAPASSGGGSGGSSGGGGGGGGGGIIILPGTSQPETNETSQQQSGSESAGLVFAAITNSGGVLSGLPIVPSANESSAPASEESETNAEGAENLPAETVETVVTAETALAPETESSSAGQESFLAAAIAALSFGTQSVWFALATALVILALLAYGGYWMNQKKIMRKR